MNREILLHVLSINNSHKHNAVVLCSWTSANWW